jgi:hypothetical protein
MGKIGSVEGKATDVASAAHFSGSDGQKDRVDLHVAVESLHHGTCCRLVLTEPGEDGDTAYILLGGAATRMLSVMLGEAVR